MSAQIIVLAEHRARRRHAAPRPASAIVAVDADDGSATDPYGLVAAVRALAANMEQMKGRSAKMQETYPSLPEEARTPELLELVDLGLATVRGYAMMAPVVPQATLERRWALAKRHLLATLQPRG